MHRWFLTGPFWRAVAFVLLAGLGVGSITGCTNHSGDAPPASQNPTQAPTYSYRVVRTYPHDTEAFTQGLTIDEGLLYEGTGLFGSSWIRGATLETGEVLRHLDLPPQYFGEGITIFDDRLIQLTWKSRVGFVYDKTSFQPLGQFNYPTEGWGITHDGTRLIMSDGTAVLRFLDPDSFAETGQATVRDNNGAVTLLNELEYVRGELYANVWKTDRIARIDPETGQVLGWIDLAEILDPESMNTAVDVLNGIAYDAVADRLFVTGKYWPAIFEIELVPME
jgi:glutamine cyclotransferase